MDTKSQNGAANLPQKNYREISSWLMAMRARDEKKERVETAKQLILAVDAKPMRQFYTSIFLQRLSYHVITTNTAEDALMFLTISLPLAIIANNDLPKMSGVDFLEKVKQDRRTRDIPFIMYTSNIDPNVKQRCEEAGCAAYLSHAAPLDELYVEIQRATEKRPRQFVRLTTHLDVVIGDSLPDVTSGRRDSITAISEKGMFVNTSSPLPLGSVHTFTFFLPTSPGWLFRTEGEIIYIHGTGDRKKQPGIGVKFLKIESSVRERIRDFIQKTLLEGIGQK
ncbi:MAG TPA: response regulator [Nitrospirota bacterium]|nr:response regulator [Nitrospirota bacterium]